MPAMLLNHLRHRLKDTVNSAYRMVQAVTVLHIGQDRERTGTFPGRHPQIFSLKGKREPQPFIIEIPGQPVVYIICGVQLRQRVQYISFHIVTQGLKRTLQQRNDSLQLVGFIGHKPAVAAPVAGKQSLNLSGSLLLVRRRCKYGISEMQ